MDCLTGSGVTLGGGSCFTTDLNSSSLLYLMMRGGGLVAGNSIIIVTGYSMNTWSTPGAESDSYYSKTENTVYKSYL